LVDPESDDLRSMNSWWRGSTSAALLFLRPDVVNRFNQPKTVDRAINKFFGLLIGLGVGLRHNYLLQVRGRKSGRIYSMPVDVLDRAGKRYLVAPRGYTQWVRNAIASGTVSLKKGRRSEEFGVRLL
jgi:hypothetical protein